MDTPPPPLPPYRFTADRGVFGKQGAVDNVKLDWGALKLQATRVRGSLQQIEATDGVTLTRGDESLTASSLRFYTGEARFTAEDGTLRSELLQIRFRALDRRPDRIAFEEVRLSPARTGARELLVSARSGFYTYADDRMTLLDARFRLFGVDLLRTRRVSFGVSSLSGDDDHVLSLPVSIRQSRISGVVTGVSFNFKPLAHVTAVAVGERSTRRGFQSLLRIRTHLLRPQAAPSLFADDPEPERSPLAALLSPPPRTTVGRSGYASVLTLPRLILEPRTTRRALYATLSTQHNREFIRRDAEVMLSRQPEFQLQGHGPVLGSGVFAFDLGVGELTELRTNGVKVKTSRRKAMAEVGFPPIARAGLRFQPQLLGSHFGYSGGQHYNVAEGRMAVEKRLGSRSGIAAAWIERHATGTAVLRSDRIETPAEAQLRVQGQRGMWIGSIGWRWDLRQDRLFDTEFGVALEGRLLEPRLTYRTQGHRVSLQVGFPLTTL